MSLRSSNIVFDSVQLDAVKKCLVYNWAFALYCLPGQDECVFVSDPQPTLDVRSDKVFFAVGFDMPFASKLTVRDVFDASATLAYNGEKNNVSSYSKVTTNNREEYLQSVNRLIEELRICGGKCVISHLFSYDLPEGKFFHGMSELYSRNKHAFRGLFYFPGEGLWLVASPELLVKADYNTGSLRTMSLAGTRRLGSKGDWDAKNIAEQRIVTDTITDDLQSVGLKPVVSECFTLQANMVEHRCNDICAEIDRDTSVESILDILSPTPAIAGYPKLKAKQQIKIAENHTRSLYGGYFGVMENNNILAHVTLRCALIRDNRMYIYAGGGITPDSNASDEWNELLLKAEQFKQYFINDK